MFRPSSSSCNKLLLLSLRDPGSRFLAIQPSKAQHRSQHCATLLLRPCLTMSSSQKQSTRRSSRQSNSQIGKVNKVLSQSIYKDESFTDKQIEQALKNATGKNEQERIDNAVDTLIFNKGIELSAAECNSNSPPSANTTVNTTATVDYENTKYTKLSKSRRHMHQKIDSSVVSERTNDGGAIISSNNDINKPSSQSIHNHSSQSTSYKTISTYNSKFDTTSTVGKSYTKAPSIFDYSAVVNNGVSSSNDNSKSLSSELESGSGAAKYNSAAVGGSSKTESRKQKEARASPPRMGTRSTRSKTTARLHDENNINGTKSPPKSGAMVPLSDTVLSPHKTTTQTRTSIPKPHQLSSSVLDFESDGSRDTPGNNGIELRMLRHW